MAVPKHNESKAKTRTRRSKHDTLEPPTYDVCEECFAPKRPHRVCPECGHYQTQSMDESQQIIEVWEY
ncbi:MAG: 50S ribosomal protein L32 [Bradymonadaceae bacterium]